MIVLVVLAVTVVNAGMNWYLWQQQHRPVSPVQPPPLPRLAEVKLRPIGQQKIFRPQRRLAQPSRPPWALLETDDYREFATRLRAVGCPEKTIRDILVADIGANFAGQRDRIQQSYPADAWLSGDQLEEIRRRNDRAEAELVRSKWALLRELFGYPVDEESMETMRSSGGQRVIWALFGFLEREQALRLLASAQDHLQQARWINRLAEGILLPEDYQQVAAIRKSFEEEIAALIGRDGVEETFLRLTLLKEAGSGALATVGMNFSADEFRNVVRIRAAGRDAIAAMFISEGFSDLKAELAPESEVEAAIARYLGPDRYADFQRARDERYRDLYRFATARGLSKREAARVYDLRAELEEELKKLETAELEVEERLGLQLAIKLRLERHIDQTFGKVIGQEYRQGDAGAWLRQIVPTGAAESKEAGR